MHASEIADDLRRAIAAGQYAYGDRLPAVREISAEYDVSQQTVAAAYAILTALGLARSGRGQSGTFVTAGKAATAHLGTFSPPDLAAAEAWTPGAKGDEGSEETTLVRRIPAPEYMAAWGLEAGADIIERTRIRRIDGTPVQHKLTVIPHALAAKTPEGHDGGPPMLAPVGSPPMKPPRGVRVADWLGWDVAGTECTITADPMDDAAAEALGSTSGAPAFRIVAITRDHAGQTVSVTVTTAPLHHRVSLSIVG